jgi:hypothetical protein
MLELLAVAVALVSLGICVGAELPGANATQTDAACEVVPREPGGAL